MQTFLPLADYAQSAACLDNKRLGKQRVECMRIYNCLIGVTQGWRNHPAVLMWKGHEGALLAYATQISTEWRSRGKQDKMLEWFLPRAQFHLATVDPPPWFGDEEFHASHRSNLLRKDPAWYSQFGWTEDSSLPYVWPVQAAKRR